MPPATPFEIPDMKQKKVSHNLPLTGPTSLKTDRFHTYFISARFSASTPIEFGDSDLELFNFFVFWD